MKISTPLTLSILFIAALTLGCKDDENDNQANYQVKFLAGSSKSNLSINEAMANITEIELESDDDSENDDSDDDNEIDVEGRYEVNLLTGQSVPPIPEPEVQAGNYSELEIEMGDDDFNALELRAEWSDSSDTYTVIVKVQDELEYEVEDDDSRIEISEDFTRQIIVLIDLEAALNSLDLNQASIDSDGNIYIDKNNNSSLLSQFKSNLTLEVDD